MGVSCKALAFNKATGTGAQAVTGVGFQPKAVILISTCATATGAFQDPESGGISIGYLDGTNGYCSSEASSDNVATTRARGTTAAKPFRIVTSTGAFPTVTVTCEVSSYTFDSDGFTLTWASNDGTSRIIYAWCLGGADITNADVREFTVTGTGALHNQSITGLGFAPDIVFTLRGQDNSALPQAYNVNFLTMGCMSRAGAQWYLEPFGFDGQPSAVTFRGLAIDRVATYSAALSYSSLDADGYTFSVGASYFTSKMIALAIKGGRWKVGNTSKPTGAAPATHTITGAGFQPVGAMFVGAQDTTFGSNHAHMEAGIGLISATDQVSVARIDRNAVSPSISKRYQDSTKAFIKVDNGTPAVDAAASFTSFDSDGISLSWSPNDAVATQFGYVLVAGNVETGSMRNFSFFIL